MSKFASEDIVRHRYRFVSNQNIRLIRISTVSKGQGERETEKKEIASQKNF